MCICCSINTCRHSNDAVLHDMPLMCEYTWQQVPEWHPIRKRRIFRDVLFSISTDLLWWHEKFLHRCCPWIVQLLHFHLFPYSWGPHLHRHIHLHLQYWGLVQLYSSDSWAAGAASQGWVDVSDNQDHGSWLLCHSSIRGYSTATLPIRNHVSHINFGHNCDFLPPTCWTIPTHYKEDWLAFCLTDWQIHRAALNDTHHTSRSIHELRCTFHEFHWNFHWKTAQSSKSPLERIKTWPRDISIQSNVPRTGRQLTV